MAQARIWADPSQNRKVIRRMYVKRYGEDFPDLGTLAQLRGCEGARVKQAYLDESARLGLTWHGRRWTRGQWDITDQMNRCLSVASSCLYGLCQAVIVSMGFNPALGFIHTDNTRAFALDIADMYRETITIPAAFSSALTGGDVDTRKRCRDMFESENLISRIVPDIYEVLGLTKVNGRFISMTAWEALGDSNRHTRL